MPLYEYECQDCGGVSEFLQKFSDKPEKQCPHCGGKINKIMSMNAFHLKGQGWYVTDYKGKNSSNSGNKEEGGAKCETSAKTDKKKEKKAKKKETSD